MNEKRDRIQAVTENALRMLDLARKKLGTLSPAEEKLFQAVANGKFADYSVDSEEDNDPAGAEKWGDERVLKADCIAWLCTDPQASVLVTYRGIGVKGAQIDGNLDLECASVPFPLDFDKSCIAGGINLKDAEIRALDLRGTHTGPISADGLKVEGSVCLCGGFKAEGQVRLLAGRIGGDFDCDEGRLINAEGYALAGGGLKVGGYVYLRNGFGAEGQVDLIGAIIGGSLECDNGQFMNPSGYALRADGLKVKDSVFLRNGFKAKGQVCLLDATIGGTLDCHKGHFINPKGDTLVADRLKVGGSVFFCDGFEAEGRVRLLGATIGGNLECDRSEFINPEGSAFDAERADVSGHVFLREDFNAEGQVVLADMRIGGSLDCYKGQFISPEGTALEGERLRVEGSVFLCKGFKAEGKVSLYSATIGGFLYCDKSQFINPKGDAFNADGLKVEGCVFLRNGFKAEGEVHMIGATIGGSLECGNGRFINPKRTALNADGLKVERYVFLRNGFSADGEVKLHSARIGRDLECDGGQFINPKRTALNANGLKVEGSVYLGIGFKAEGEVWLSSATIGTNLACGMGQFINPDGRALDGDGLKVEGSIFLRNGFEAKGEVSLSGATIGGHFVFTEVTSPTDVTLDLRSARIGTLCDDQKSWPENGKLFLHGLVYGEIDHDAPIDAKTRIDWLHRQPTEHFRTQPYEQLAAVLRKGGHDADAKKILIAKAKDRARLTQLTWPEKCWYHVSGKFIGYGYRPWRAFWIGLMVVVIGWFLFGIGFRADVMTPTNEGVYVSDSGGENLRLSENYPKFNALVYSLDMFVPLVNLHQASYWLPNANQGFELFNIKGIRLLTGSLLRYYLWFHIVMGWILTTLLVVGLTGLIRS